MKYINPLRIDILCTVIYIVYIYCLLKSILAYTRRTHYNHWCNSNSKDGIICMYVPLDNIHWCSLYSRY